MDVVIIITTNKVLTAYSDDSQYNRKVCIPKFIEELKNVSDTASSVTCSVALCGPDNNNISLIITYWFGLFQIPADLFEILLSYIMSNTLYSTTNEPGSGHPRMLTIKIYGIK